MITGFKWLGRLEALSFLILLLIAMPLKYLAGNPDPVRVVGMAHGILFIAYVLYANFIAGELNWTVRTRILSFIGAVLPFGTLVFEKKVLNH
jgi:integral membrane protein